MTTKLKLSQTYPPPPSESETTASLDSKVSLDTDQTITGNKTLNTIKINGDGGYQNTFNWNIGGLTKLTTPSSNKYATININDSNKSRVGWIEYAAKSDSSTNIALVAQSNITSNVYGSLQVGVDSSNNPYTKSENPVIVQNQTSTFVNPTLALVGSTNNSVFQIRNDVVKGTAPSTSKIQGIEFYGTDHTDASRRLAHIDAGVNTSNISSIVMAAYGCKTATDSTRCVIGAYVDANDTCYTAAPTPTTSDSSTKIATTAFVKSAMNTWSAVTVTPVTTYCTSVGGNHMAVYQNPYLKLCSVGFNIQLAATAIPGNTAIITGFPKAIHNYGCILGLANDTSIRAYINTAGALHLDGAKTLTVSTWAEGSITYPYSSL